jgi:hypothetical protein
MKNKLVRMRGGLDLITPHIEMPDGHVVASTNYEPEVRGYKRIGGFERFDGQPSPSEAAYYRLDFDAGTTAISTDDIVIGATSGATGTAVADAVVVSGSWDGNDAAGFIPLVDVTGTYTDDENLQVSAATVAVANGTQSLGTNDTYIQAAIEARRDAIAAVPGSGDIRGIWEYKGDIYAFRDNVAGTACVMYKATNSGWEAIAGSTTIPFTNGGAWVIDFSMPDSWANFTEATVITPQVGDTITQTSYGTTVWSSGVISTETTTTHWTGTIEQIVVDSGSFAGQDAVGRFIVRVTSRTTSPFAGSGHINLPGYVDAEPMTGLMFAAISSVTLLEVKLYDVIIGESSAETATVTQVRIDSGDWADNDAIGSFIVTSVSGTFSDEGIYVGASYSYLDSRYFADLTGSSQATATLPAGGRYDFVNYNFLGSSSAILAEVPDSVLTVTLESP